MMTQQEVLEYNKRCAEFLGRDKKGTQDVTWTFPDYLNGQLWVDEHFFNNTDEYCGRRQTKVSELKFHSDWNWIMEVVDAIEKLGYQFDITGNEVGVNSNIMSMENISTGGTMNSYNRSYYPTIISICEEEYSKKDAVVQAINQFLIWYNENSKNTLV